LSGHPLRLRLRASPVLTLVTVAVHALAAAVLWFLVPGIPGILTASLIGALAFVVARQRTLLWSAGAPATLELKRDGLLALHLRGGGRLEAVASERRYVSRWLVVLSMRLPRAHRTILVVRDMLSAAEFRHLRLWALWQALPATGRGTPP
jgi:hypothetical protein